MNISDFISYSDLASKSEFQKHRLLDDLIPKRSEPRLTVYMFVTHAELYEVMDIGEVEPRSGWGLRMMEVYPDCAAQFILNGMPVTFNFLKTKERMIDYPDPADTGLYFDATPPLDSLSNLFFHKEDVKRYLSPTSVTETEGISSDWKWIRLAKNKVIPLNSDQSKILKFLKENDGLFSSFEISERLNLDNIGCPGINGNRVFDFANVFKPKSAQRDFVAIDSKRHRGQYRATDLLKALNILPVESTESTEGLA